MYTRSVVCLLAQKVGTDDVHTICVHVDLSKREKLGILKEEVEGGKRS